VLKVIALPIAIVALAACSWAASPLGAVSSTQPFDLNGATAPTAGVPTWPVAAGDVIATHSAPATIVFRDGSRVVVAENSKVKIESQDRKPVLRLLQGSGNYTLAPKPSLALFVLEKPATANPAGQGVIALTSQGNSNPQGANNLDCQKHSDDDGCKPPKPSKHK
jgi:hypothetical protein